MNSQQTTGNIVTLPNSLMLSHSIKKESYFRGYFIKNFTFKVFDPTLAKDFEEKLLNKAIEISAPYLEEAKKEISKFCDKEGIVIPGIGPRTKILVGEDNYDILVLVKLPAQNLHIADLEQDLNRFYLDWRVEELTRKKSD